MRSLLGHLPRGGKTLEGYAHVGSCLAAVPLPRSSILCPWPLRCYHRCRQLDFCKARSLFLRSQKVGTLCGLSQTRKSLLGPRRRPTCLHSMGGCCACLRGRPKRVGIPLLRNACSIPRAEGPNELSTAPQVTLSDLSAKYRSTSARSAASSNAFRVAPEMVVKLLSLSLARTRQRMYPFGRLRCASIIGATASTHA